MKKRIAFIVMLSTILSSKIAFADTGIVNTTSAPLYVRQNSSLSSSITGSIPKNTKIDTLGKYGDFYKISYKGKTGYVYSSFIKIVTGNTVVEKGGQTTVGKDGQITASYLNVRSGAGATSSVIGVIKRGSKVTTYEKTNGFYKIKYDGKTGYISASYVKGTGENSNGTSSPAASVEKVTGTGTITVNSSLNVRRTAAMGNNVMGVLYSNNKVEICGTQGSFYKIKYSGKVGYVSKSYVKVTGEGSSSPTASVEKVTGTGTITVNSSLNVRRTAAMGNNVMGVLYSNNKVEICGTQGSFYKIKYSGKVGYVSKSYVKVTGQGSSSPTASVEKVTGTGTITVSSSLNVRRTAAMGNNVMGVLYSNSKVDIYGTQGSFYKIKYSGKVGYVSKSYVKLKGEGSSSPTAPVEKVTEVGTITVSSSLNVRRTAAAGNNVMGLLYSNNKVNIYGTQGSFYKIKYSGQWGYISKSYVRVGNDSGNNNQSNASVSGDKVVAAARAFLGTPYVWGGTTPARYNSANRYIGGGFDCSGLVQYVYKKFGVNLPRVTMDQVNVGAAVSINNLQKGDLVYFTTNSSNPSQVSHVGMYVGNNQFIQSPKTGDVVKISSLSGYYRQKFVIGRRMIK